MEENNAEKLDLQERQTEDDEQVPWSESSAVKRITEDRKELIDLVNPVKADARMVSFTEEYEKLYKQLIVCHTRRQNLRRKVRELKAIRGVSAAKAATVANIYANTDERIAQLRREVNIVYHQLIELQEQEDRSRAEFASLIASIKDIRELIKERESEMPTVQLKTKERMEEKLEEMQRERDNIVAENDKLRERICEFSSLQAKLDSSLERVQSKIAETQQAIVKVGSTTAKECAKRATTKAALGAVEKMIQARDRDINDLKKALQRGEEDCKAIRDNCIRSSVLKETKLKEIKLLDDKIKKKNYDVMGQMQTVHELENEVESRRQSFKKREQELHSLKTQAHQLDHLRRSIRTKQKDLDSRKEKILAKKDAQKKKNQRMYEEIENTKKKQEALAKELLNLLKQRDLFRKYLMRDKAIREKEASMFNLRMLAIKRLRQDNLILIHQREDQTVVHKKLELERDKYYNQYVYMTKKCFAKWEEEKRWIVTMMKLQKKTEEEEKKMVEMQNLYEVTRNEHVIYTRHILQMRDLIQRLGAKTTFLAYETQKLVLERNYRDECIVKETLAMTKVNRQNYILKANLHELKDTNTRTKLIIENQDLEEKKLVKMLRVMRQEKLRENKTLERVVRDMDGLDLALIRRTHELHDLYKAIKLRQSLLQKGENMYNIRWKEHQAVTTKLNKTRALRRLDQKRRKLLDMLMDCVKFLHTQVENTQLRSKGLCEELSHPRNIHRWRSLLGRDPEAYLSVRNMHLVRRQIQDKVDETEALTARIHVLDGEYIALSTATLTQPSPETVLQLKIYKSDLTIRLGQIKRVTRELRFILDERKDVTDRQGMINRKLQEIRDIWLKHMAKERRRSKLTPFNPLATLKGPNGPLVGTSSKEQPKGKKPVPVTSGTGPLTSPAPISQLSDRDTNMSSVGSSAQRNLPPELCVIPVPSNTPAFSSGSAPPLKPPRRRGREEARQEEDGLVASEGTATRSTTLRQGHSSSRSELPCLSEDSSSEDDGGLTPEYLRDHSRSQSYFTTEDQTTTSESQGRSSVFSREAVCSRSLSLGRDGGQPGGSEVDPVDVKLGRADSDSQLQGEEEEEEEEETPGVRVPRLGEDDEQSDDNE